MRPKSKEKINICYLRDLNFQEVGTKFQMFKEKIENILDTVYQITVMR